MGCPCCDIRILDDNGNDQDHIPICPYCGLEAPLPEHRIDLFLETYHMECVREALMTARKTNLRFDPTIFR